MSDRIHERWLLDQCRKLMSQLDSAIRGRDEWDRIVRDTEAVLEELYLAYPDLRAVPKEPMAAIAERPSE